MTKEIKKQMCELLGSKSMLINDGRLLPKIYVVGDRPYWFLNAAKRAAYGTKHPVEVIDIGEAYKVVPKRMVEEANRHGIEYYFDQTGETFRDGRLFCNNNVKADEAEIKVINVTA